MGVVSRIVEMPGLVCVKFSLIVTFLCIAFLVVHILDDMDPASNIGENKSISSKAVHKARKIQLINHKDLLSKSRKKDIGYKIIRSPQYLTRQFKKSVISQRNGNIRKMFVNQTQRVENVCKKYRSYQTKPDFFLPKAYSLEPLEKLAICRTAKHGSTTWAKNFIHIYLGKEEFRKGPKVYQRRLEEIEQKAYTREQKVEVLRSLKNPDHEYLSFFVCRNPIEKLVSVYKYMKVLKNRPDFGEGSHPTWEKYIRAVVSEDNYLGLTRPLYLTCNLCKNQYDAIIMMETYTEDSRKLLTECGLGWVVPSHTNDHGTASLSDHNLERMFNQVPARFIRGLVDRYFLDFKFCGYEETLHTLQMIAKDKE